MPDSSPVPARLAAQGLAGPPAATAEAAVRRVLAVQGQDARGFRLAVRARTAGVAAADVVRGLDERRLVVAWLNRGTLHLVTAEDLRLLEPLTTPQLRTANAARLAQEGVTPALADRGVDVVRGALAEHGDRTRPELKTALDAAGVPTAGQALVHVLYETALRHRLVRGPVRGGEHAMVLADDWLGPAPEHDREAALAQVARRYLTGHGPATDRDLAYWAGITLGAARAGLAAIADETVETPLGLDLVDRPPAAEAPPRLLGNFDPLLHGWVSRRPVLGDHDPRIVLGGTFRSFALVDGAAVGLWRIVAGRVRIAPFAPLPRRAEQALVEDAGRVLAFLGLPPKDAVVEPA